MTDDDIVAAPRPRKMCFPHTDSLTDSLEEIPPDLVPGPDEPEEPERRPVLSALCKCSYCFDGPHYLRYCPYDGRGPHRF